MCDVAIGHAAPNARLTNSMLMPWRCAAKPVIALAVLKLVETSAIRLSDPVSSYLAGFGRGPSDSRVSIEDLLAHRAVFSDDPPYEKRHEGLEVEELLGLQEILRICPKDSAADSNPFSIWVGYTALAKVVEEVTSSSLQEWMDAAILRPAGVSNLWLGPPPRELFSGPDSGGIVDLFDGNALRPAPRFTKRHFLWQAAASPSVMMYAPAIEIAKLYQGLLALCLGRESSLPLKPSTVRQMLTPATPVLEPTSRVLDTRPVFGLGFLLQSKLLSAACSASSFGHGSLDTTLTFADPDNEIVVAGSFNFEQPMSQSSSRNQSLGTAIYRDLGIT